MSRSPKPAMKPMRLNFVVVPLGFALTALIFSASGCTKNPAGIGDLPSRLYSVTGSLTISFLPSLFTRSVWRIAYRYSTRAELLQAIACGAWKSWIARTSG